MVGVSVQYNDDDILKSENVFIVAHFPFFLLLLYIYTIFKGVIPLGERGVNGEDYLYDLFPNVAVHCIVIYAVHLKLHGQFINYIPLSSLLVST